MIDFRSELQALVAAYEEHGGKWLQHHEDALADAVDHARAVLSAEADRAELGEVKRIMETDCND